MRVNSLGGHDIEYMSSKWAHNIAGGRMEHRLSDALDLMSSQLIPGGRLKKRQEGGAFAPDDRVLLSQGHTQEIADGAQGLQEKTYWQY